MFKRKSSSLNEKIFVETTYEDKSVPKRWHRKWKTPGNCPKERIKHSQHGESLKSSSGLLVCS